MDHPNDSLASVSDQHTGTAEDTGHLDELDGGFGGLHCCDCCDVETGIVVEGRAQKVRRFF